MNNKRVRLVAARFSLAVAVAVTSLVVSSVADASTRPILVDDSGYVISVPREWTRSFTGEEASMKIHLLVHPVREVQGHFTVHLLKRNNASVQTWVGYHVEKNLPAAHGAFHIESQENVTAGMHEAVLFHVRGLEEREGYGLREALIFTENHVVFLSYLYDLTTSSGAAKAMEGVVDSFSDTQAARERACNHYEEARILGIPDFSLVLRLPEEWVPEDKKSRDQRSIALPSGGRLKVLTFSRINGGLEGLLKQAKRRASELREVGYVPVSEMSGLKDGICFDISAPGSNESNVFYMGLHSKGGYAMVLSSAKASEKSMMSKVMKRAVLMDPKEAEKRHRSALAGLRKGIKANDIVEVNRHLSVVELFPDDKCGVRVLETGLGASEEIQIVCAKTLWRMGSKRAGMALEKSVTSTKVCSPAKKICVEAIANIGGLNAERTLKKLQKNLPRDSWDLRRVVNESLISMYN